jgi:transposase-like protein
MSCPRCGSNYIVKNGISLSNKQKYKCRDCNKQFVLNPEKYISEEKKAIIDNLLLEKISLRGIARSVGVSGVWLQKYVKEKYREQPEELHVQKKAVEN